MKRILWSAAIVGSLLLGSCGTVGDLKRNPRIYGGTRDVIQECGRRPSLNHCGWLIAPDLPFSFALDTVVLPFTVIYQLFFSP